jgi:hypothetical protein
MADGSKRWNGDMVGGQDKYLCSRGTEGGREIGGNCENPHDPGLSVASALCVENDPLGRGQFCSQIGDDDNLRELCVKSPKGVRVDIQG